jgi:hypothetical protein
MPLQAKLIKNYKNLGWDVWLLSNDWISLTAIPEIGGRIMEYALGNHSPLFINRDLLGQTIKPAEGQEWPNFGGYKVWPAPQETWQWPPPPILDHGRYPAEIEHQNEESVTLCLKSHEEKWGMPGIRLERRITMKHNSAKVRLRETFINESDRDISLSIWDVTQLAVQHFDKKDHENFWIYFPINPKSRYGKSGIYATAETPALKGEAAPGIYGVQYDPHETKIFSDCHEGWIGHVDHGLQLAYTKTFPNYHGKPYPDNDARIAVYTSEKLPYMEMEIMGPILELSPEEEISLSIDWGITCTTPPILDVNDIGIVSEHLAHSKDRLTGQYGVFFEGSLFLVFRDLRGIMLKKSLPQAVHPNRPVQINLPAQIDPDMRLIEVQINGSDGHLLGVLDSLEIIPRR